MNKANAPFKIISTLAIIVGGVIAARTAKDPSQVIVWMVAYLVLVAGVIQYFFGAAQATLLRSRLPSLPIVLSQVLILNLGNIGVIFGTLRQSIIWLIIGTALYDIALIWLFALSWKGKPAIYRFAYWVVLLAMFASSILGIFLAPFS